MIQQTTTGMHDYCQNHLLFSLSDQKPFLHVITPHFFPIHMRTLHLLIFKKKMYVLRFKTSTDPLIFFLFCFMFMHWLSEFIMLFHLKYMNYLPRIGVIFVDKDGEEKHVKVSKLVEAT